MIPQRSIRARSLAGFRALTYLLLAGAASASNLQAPGNDPAHIRVDVHMVVLHASVRDKRGAPVSGLRKEQFQVEENGRPQTISVFQHEDLPLSIGLIVDNSGSMKTKRIQAAKAVVAFAAASNPGDELFIVNFNESVTFGMDDSSLRGISPVQLENALLSVPAAGRTALYDAIDTALEHVRQSRKESDALVVISDGRDNASKHTLNRVLQTAERSDALIYAIAMIDDDDPQDTDAGVLKKIAAETGGEAFLPKTPSDLSTLCLRIAQDLRTQYTIGYSPADGNLDGTYRRIRLRVTGASGSEMHVRVRRGYVATPEKAVP